MTSKCKVCGATEDSAPFYKGVTSRCCECHKTLVKKNREEKRDYYIAYHKKRYRENPIVRQRLDAYAKTEKGMESRAKARAKWLRNNPVKRAAHVILGNAVRDGRIFKPKQCQKCGVGGRIHGHHHDYAKPLEVTWLCAPCHGKEHF